jgi:UDP-GlcNAc3NAcA epimerase
MKKILAIIGARPQFIKHAPIELAFKGKLNLISIHTGQHYDENMSKIFFDQLKMSKPDYMLQIGSAGHGVQTGKMMMEIEPIMLGEKPDAVLVYGDTNSTLAGALVAAKLNIPVIHLEAGLRSYNREMPEEINRVLTDHVSKLLLVPTGSAVENLKKEGITENVFLTGDVMCDMLIIAKERLRDEEITAPYCYVTIHRPYNTDAKDRLKEVLNSLQKLTVKVKFALHPRTANKMEEFGLSISDYSNIEFLPPVSYFENIQLQSKAKAVITDSGGIQKEAYLLKVKCITIRPETEWVETLNNKWNELAYDRLDQLENIINNTPGAYSEGIYGDGRAAEQIADIILKNLL